MSQTNERRRELYRKNRDQILARNRAYRETHKEEIATWQKDYRKVYYSESKDAIKAAAITYKRDTKYSTRHIKLRLLRFAKCRAKKNGIPFDLSIGDFYENDLACPIFGTLLEPAITRTNQYAENTPTLDRDHTKLGYVKGNIQVISQ